jgi:putative hydrolase of the HAD superfamily
VGEIAAVIFDLGGVVMESPLHAIARYERELGLAPDAINRAIVAAGDTGAWSRLERGELTVDEFYTPFEADCRACGIDVSGPQMMARIAQASVARPRMLAAIERIRQRGLRVGALTNNWIAPSPSPARTELRARFHAFIESSAVGLRKPDPRIYLLACRQLGVEPARTAFLDDIGRNLKSARGLGMTTIKVDDPERALAELGALLGVDLG